MRALLFLPLVLLLVPTWAGEGRLPLYRDPIALTATRVALDPDDPARRRVGALTYLGGIALASDDPAFGGFSAMTVRGDRFTLLSDGGGVLGFSLGADWVPRAVRVADLPAGPGTGWLKFDRDSEAMAIDPATGDAWVAFENSNQIWRYTPALDRAVARAAPPLMRGWVDNGGAEAIAPMPDGSVVVLAEKNRWSETWRARPRRVENSAVRLAGDPTRAGTRGYRFAYSPPAGYLATDAAALPDGRLLVLNRRMTWRGFDSALTLIAADAIAPGRIVRGRVIARLAPPLIHDNLEAMAIVREGDATILWLASDDNQSMFQRSLLLKFRLEP